MKEKNVCENLSYCGWFIFYEISPETVDKDKNFNFLAVLSSPACPHKIWAVQIVYSYLHSRATVWVFRHLITIKTLTPKKGPSYLDNMFYLSYSRWWSSGAAWISRKQLNNDLILNSLKKPTVHSIKISTVTEKKLLKRSRKYPLK